MNILLGLCMYRGETDISAGVKEMMCKELTQEGIEFGLFDLYKSLDEVTEAVKSNKYDVVICMEELSGTSVGRGSISGWYRVNPNLNVILLVNIEKKSGKKLRNLFELINYYNALYTNELTGANLAVLLRQPRSKENAYIYYGLDKPSAAEGVVDAASLGEQKEPAVMKEEVPEVQAEPAEAEVGKERSFEEALTSMNRIFETMENKEEEMQEDVKAKMPVEEVHNDFFSFAGSTQESVIEHVKVEETVSDMVTEAEPVLEELPGNAFFSREQTVEEENVVPQPSFTYEERPVKKDEAYYQRKREDEVLGEQILREFGGPDVRKETVVETDMYVPAVHGKKEQGKMRENRNGVIHVKGSVEEVMDENLLMVELSQEINLGEGMEITDYKITLLVNTGLSGYMENGKYKSPRIVVNGYGSCVLDDYTMIVEVVDKDLFCLEDQISGKACNVIFAKQ